MFVGRRTLCLFVLLSDPLVSGSRRKSSAPLAATSQPAVDSLTCGKAAEGRAWETRVGKRLVPAAGQTTRQTGAHGWQTGGEEHAQMMNGADGAPNLLGARPHHLTLPRGGGTHRPPGKHFGVTAAITDHSVSNSNVFKM